MFIYHFNRLIHNKIIWGGFALIIALTFGLSGLFAGRQQGGGGGAAGKLDGKNLSQSQLDETLSSIRAMESFRGGAESLPNDVVFTQALVRIATGRLADRLGLSVSNLEFQSEIRRQPAFLVNGVFSMDAYQQFMRRSRNISIEQFEDYVSQDIAASKIAAIINSASWVSPTEAEDQIANITDRLDIRYAILEDKFAASEIAASEQQVRDYYDGNPDAFLIPAKTSASYVAIPYTNYIPALTITREDLLEYYEENLEQYTHYEDVLQIKEKENAGEEDAGDEGAGEDNEPEMETTTILVQRELDEVADEITLILQNKWTREAAEADAYTNLLETASASGGLESVAALFGLEVSETGFFGSEGPEGFENPGRFAALAGEFVEEDGVTPGVYEIFMGGSILYIFNPSGYAPAHLPPFEEVRAQAAVLATAKAKADAFLEQQQAVYDGIKAAMDAGQTFEEAAEAASLAPTNTVLAVNELGYNPLFPGAYNIAFAAMNLQQGGFAKPVAIPAQGTAFVFLAGREQGDPMTLEYMRGDLQERMAQSQAMFIQGQWSQWFEGNIQYVPNRQPAEQAAQPFDF